MKTHYSENGKTLCGADIGGVKSKTDWYQGIDRCKKCAKSIKKRTL